MAPKPPAKLPLQKMKKLKELKQKHAYQLAQHKDELVDEGVTDDTLLDTLLVLEASTLATEVLNNFFNELSDQNVLSFEESLILSSRVVSGLSHSTLHRIYEEMGDEAGEMLTEDLLFSFKELRPEVQVIVFEEDSIHVFDNKRALDDLEDEEE